MDFDIRNLGAMLGERDISMVYSGPIWPGGIDGMAEMLLRRLAYDELDEGASQSVFSVFVEQINNMLHYSAEKEIAPIQGGATRESPRGDYVMGIKNAHYFVQTGNAVTDRNASILRERIDRLNSLDKAELRQLYRQQIRASNDNPESHGAGIGLTEIARRAEGPIEYAFSPLDGGRQYFTMRIEVRKGGRN